VSRSQQLRHEHAPDIARAPGNEYFRSQRGPPDSGQRSGDLGLPCPTGWVTLIA
jgi:hypothetical protein